MADAYQDLAGTGDGNGNAAPDEYLGAAVTVYLYALQLEGSWFRVCATGGLLSGTLAALLPPSRIQQGSAPTPILCTDSPLPITSGALPEPDKIVHHPDLLARPFPNKKRQGKNPAFPE